MKTRLAFMALALLLFSACASTEKPPDTQPEASPSKDAPTPSYTPTGSPEPVVTLPGETEPPTSLPSQTPPPSVSPSSSGTPYASPSPSGAAEPSPSLSPSPEQTPESTPPPNTFTGRVVPELPELTFEIYSVQHGALYRAERLVVLNGGSPYQEIDLREYSSETEGITCASPDMNFLLFDMNYDGCRDFRVRDYATSTPNNQFLTFLWDPGSMSFVFSPEISALSNPEFDEANQFVHSRIILLPDIIDSSFTFEAGELVLQAETMRRLDTERSVWMVTVSLRINGAMTVTEQYEEEYDGSI